MSGGFPKPPHHLLDTGPRMSQKTSSGSIYHSEVPFWRDIRVLRVLTQIAFLIVVLIAGYWLVSNLLYNLNELGLDLSFRFLNLEAGFLVSEGPRFEATDTFGRAFVVGLANTLRVAALGIVLTTILGLVVGVALLSNNFLVRTIASTYVEIMRNTPLLVQLFFLYFAVILQLPRVKEHLSVGPIMLSNRGFAMPWPEPTASWNPWLISLAFGLAVAVVLWIWRSTTARRTGRPLFSFVWIPLTFLVIAVAGWIAVPGPPFFITVPEVQGFKIVGGVALTPEFAALLIGLVSYTAAFVADIVRSGILAVSKGQVEAARALGLTSFQALRLIILPQAIRVIIPPLINQYLNLTKNSSLAIAIGYPDLYAVSNTIFNQSGKVVQVILLLMSVYLSISLFIALVMNVVNRRMQIVER